MLVKYLNTAGTATTELAGSIFKGEDAVYPIFNTKAEADAWSLANPGKIAFARNL